MFARKPSQPKMAGGLLAFIGMSAVASVLIAAAVTPAIAVSGLTANGTLGIFEELPDYLQIANLAEKTSLYAKDKDGKEVLLASFYAQNRVTVPLDEISPYVKDAAVAAEDPRFYEHGGIDLIGTARAFLSNASSGSSQGGSSITQQYVKNILVMRAEDIADPEERKAAYTAATQTTLERKLKEMKLAIGIESRYSKAEILNGYLNISSFGGRVYGIEAAAEHYFGVKAKDLTLSQAASLVATVNNPNNLRIDNPEFIQANTNRRNYVLDRMLAEGKIQQAEHDAAIKEPVTPKITPASSGCQTAGGAAYFCDYVTWVIKNDKAFGATEDERWAAFLRGGWKIMTTLDPAVQAAAQEAMDSRVPKIVPEGDIASSTVSVQSNTGRILSMYQSKDYSQDEAQVASGANYSSVNFNTDSKYGSSTGFPVGSTYKVFTMEEWLKQGHGLQEVVYGQERVFVSTDFKNSCDGVGPLNNWKPTNDHDSGQTVSVMEGLKQSLNLTFINMATKVDLCEIRKDAEAFGVHRADGKQLTSNPSAVIGTNEISPLTMAVAVAGIANDGKTCTAIAIDSITDHNGNTITPPKTTCSQSVTPDIARAMEYAMEFVHSAGGTGAQTATGDNIPWIVKTGTSENQEHNWVMGATNKVGTVVWIGNVSGHLGVARARFTGGQPWVTKQLIWRDIMRVANPIYGGDKFGTPDPNMIKGKSVTVPAIKGLTIQQATDLLTSVGMSIKDGGAIDSELPEGTIVKSDPESEAAASVGAVVTVYTSNHTLVAGPPNIVGMTVAQATAALTAAGFTLNVKATASPTPCPSPSGGASAAPCPTAASPVILTQDITGGFVKPRSVVNVTVSG